MHIVARGLQGISTARTCELARKTKDGPQARRLLALAAICDGATRTEAARIALTLFPAHASGADMAGGPTAKLGSRPTERENKSRPKAALNSKPDDRNQETINAGFDFRRYAMKPRPTKPRIIMAHVDGSGTAGVSVAPTLPVFPFAITRSVVKKILLPS